MTKLHVYQDSSVDTEAVSAYLAPLSDGSHIAVVTLGRGVRLHAYTPADCDALIAVAVEAKRLLSPPVPVDAETATAVSA